MYGHTYRLLTTMHAVSSNQTPKQRVNDQTRSIATRFDPTASFFPFLEAQHKNSREPIRFCAEMKSTASEAKRASGLCNAWLQNILLEAPGRVRVVPEPAPPSLAGRVSVPVVSAKDIDIDRIAIFLSGVPVQCQGHNIVLQLRVSRDRGAPGYSVEWTVTAVDGQQLDADEFVHTSQDNMPYADVQRVFCNYANPLAFNRIMVELTLNRADSRFLATAWSKLPFGVRLRFPLRERYLVDNHQWRLFRRSVDARAFEFVMEADIEFEKPRFGEHRMMEMRRRVQAPCDPRLQTLVATAWRQN